MTWTRRTAICCTGAGRASPGTSQLYRSPHARWMRCGVAMLRQSVRKRVVFVAWAIGSYVHLQPHAQRSLPPTTGFYLGCYWRRRFMTIRRRRRRKGFFT